jgi:hypothetical protein
MSGLTPWIMEGMTLNRSQVFWNEQIHDATL